MGVILNGKVCHCINLVLFRLNFFRVCLWLRKIGEMTIDCQTASTYD